LHTEIILRYFERFYRVRSCVFLCKMLILCTLQVYGQKPSGVGSGGNIPQEKLNQLKNNQYGTTQDDENGLDSTVYKYFFIDDIYHVIDNADSLADMNFLRQYGLSKNGQYVNTGNLGSAVQSLIFQPEIKYGFNTGYTQYQYYHIRPENFRFYEQNRPISDLYFSQMGGQDNIYVGSDFSRNFTNGLSFSLNYQRISQKGFYNSQDTKSTSLGLGLRYQSPKDRYNAILLFTHNANAESHSGGIKYDSLLSLEFKRNIPVILESAATRQQERSFSLVQYYKLNPPSNKSWRLYVRNDLQYVPSYYKFYDTKVPDSINTSFYHGLANDTRGIRRYTNVQHVSDGFYLHGEKIKGISGRAGLVYDYFDIKDDPTFIKRSDLTLTFDGIVPLFKAFEIKAKGRLGLLANAGNFDISGDMQVKISSLATLKGGIRIFRTEPSYRSSLLNINYLNVYDTSFSKPFGTILQAELDIPKLNFNASIIQTVINEPLYWPTTGKALQYNGVFSMTYLRVSQNIRLGSFHLDNEGHLQLQSSSLFPIPKFFSSHQFYIQGALFRKALEFNLGLDARFIPAYSGAFFQPLFGSFNQTDTSLPFYPASNLFISVRISSFRAMFIMENFSQYFRNDYNFDIVNHPQFDPKFRMGFRWLLKD